MMILWFRNTFSNPHKRIERAASTLGKRGAQARADAAREKRKAFHRAMRKELGLPEAEALR